MSIDLTLLPVNCELPNMCYSHTVLPLQTNSRDLFELIETLTKEKSNSMDFITEGDNLSGFIPDNFSCYLATNKEGETAYGNLKEDAYGSPLKWVRASQLQSIVHHKAIQENPMNKQAFAYIMACQPQQKIVLFWS